MPANIKWLQLKWKEWLKVTERNVKSYERYEHSAILFAAFCMDELQKIPIRKEEEECPKQGNLQ